MVCDNSTRLHSRPARNPRGLEATREEEGVREVFIKVSNSVQTFLKAFGFGMGDAEADAVAVPGR